MQVFGVRLVGINAENGQKLLFTIVLIVLVLALQRGVLAVMTRALRKRTSEYSRFLVRQAANLITAIILLIGILSVWFDDPTRLVTAIGLVAAGLAFALQRVVTTFAGYFLILRGNTFTVGDRITMGSVRGDVLRLGFMQTTIMEMGQPPAVQGADPAIWVRSRQYTGRVVTVTNDKVFEDPVFNYSRDFPYLWEELTLPITYTADRERAERILLDAAHRHTGDTVAHSAEALSELSRRYFLSSPSVEPAVYYRLTDNWLELTLRFVTDVRGVREVKSAMSREILRDLDEAGIGIASATVEIVGMPALRVARPPGSAGHPPQAGP